MNDVVETTNSDNSYVGPMTPKTKGTNRFTEQIATHNSNSGFIKRNRFDVLRDDDDNSFSTQNSPVTYDKEQREISTPVLHDEENRSVKDYMSVSNKPLEMKVLICDMKNVLYDHKYIVHERNMSLMKHFFGRIITIVVFDQLIV